MKLNYDFNKTLTILLIISGGLSIMYGGYSLGNVLTAERVLMGFLDDDITELQIPPSVINELKSTFLMLKIFSIIPIGVGFILIITSGKQKVK